MKTKNLVLFMICVVLTSIFILLFSNQRPSFHTILTETQKHLSQIKGLQNFKVTEQHELRTDTKYLHALGFIPHPRLFNDSNSNFTLPVIVTGATTGHLEEVIGLIKASRHFLPDHTILVYDLDLEHNDLIFLNKYCNSSNCTIRKFNLNFYPSHVSDFSIYAHRPLLIQDALNHVGAILWLDPSFRPITRHIESFLQKARQFGIASWGIDQPTSALTHPRMFDYFHTQQENYFFHRMVEPSHFAIYNLEQIHNRLMLPWIKCSLSQECIAPIGAQSTGCRFDKKPMYRYSGCHRYDASALNVLLGIMFNYDASSYIVEERLFCSVEQETNGSENPPNITSFSTRTEVEFA